MLSIAGNVTKGFTFRKQDVAVEEPTADEGDDSEEGPYRQRRCEPTRNAHFQPLM
jgi:hypothetical protein